MKKAEERFARRNRPLGPPASDGRPHRLDPRRGMDYAAVVSGETFAVPEQVRPGAILALAVRFGTTRLIDNLVLN